MSLRYLDNGHRKTHAHVSVERDFNVMHSERLDLHAAEKVDVRRAAVDFPQLEADGCLGDNFVVGIEQTGHLLESPDASAPPRPEAKFEKTYRDLRSRNRPDDADQSLRAANLRADVLAKDRRLQVGNDRIHGRGSEP